MEAPTADTVTTPDALANGMDALRDALLSRDADALARATARLEQTVARWQAAAGETPPTEQWRERAFALRMKNMHNGRLLLADLNWIGAVMRWLQHDHLGGTTYAANGARQNTTPARTRDYRG